MILKNINDINHSLCNQMVYLFNRGFKLTPSQSSVSFKLKNTKISNKLSHYQHVRTGLKKIERQTGLEKTRQPQCMPHTKCCGVVCNPQM
jgi:hypothetical protein